MNPDGRRKLEVLETSPGDITALTFVFPEEDYTLAKPLQRIILKNPEVKTCGYSVLHPTENKFCLRIETHGVPATDVLEKGLQDLQNVCEHVTKAFEDARHKYDAEQAMEETE